MISIFEFFSVTLSRMFSIKLWLNIIGEFGPIIAFLLTYGMHGFATATVVMMVATVGSFLLLYLYERHVPLFAIMSAGIVLFFGGVSLVVHNPSLFILRDTISDGILGLALLYSLRTRPLLHTFFDYVFCISERGWYLLTLRWGIFCLILSGTNEIVRNTLSPDMWVEVKVGIIFATFLFGIYQLTLSRRERLPEASPFGLRIR